MSEQASSPRRRRWPWRKLIGPTLLVWVLWWVDLGEVAAVLARSDWRLVAAALALQPLALGLKALRWWLLVRRLGERVPMGRAVQMYVMATFFGIVTPGRMGELWKALELKKAHGVPLAHGLPATLLDRALDFYLYFAVGLVFLFLLGFLPGPQPVFWGLVVLLAVLPVLLARRAVIDRLARWLLLNRLARKVTLTPETTAERFAAACRALVSPVLLPAGAITALAAGVLFGQFHLLLRAAGLELSFASAVVTASVLKFLSNVPVSVAGLGTRDVALVLIFRKLGQPAEAAVGVSLLVLLVNHVGVALIGAAACLLHRPAARDQGPRA